MYAVTVALCITGNIRNRLWSVLTSVLDRATRLLATLGFLFPKPGLLKTVVHCDECSQDFLSIFTGGDATPCGNAEQPADDVEQTSNSAARTATGTQSSTTESAGSSERLARRVDRPTTLSRPVQLPDCCNFRRQPWRSYVYGDFNYSAEPRCFSGVDDELGAAADNDAVVRIIESLQHPGFSNGCHGDSVNKPATRKHVPYENSATESTSSTDQGSRDAFHVSSGGYGESKENGKRTDSSDPTAHNGRKSSPEIANVQTATISLSSSVKGGDSGNVILGLNGVAVRNGDQEHREAVVEHPECSPTRQMRQDINQNLRCIEGAKKSEGVGPEVKDRCQNGNGNSRHGTESPAAAAAGRQQKSKTRRSRNRSLASRDQRLTNGDVELSRNQDGGRKSTRSRTLSPALTKRFDYHVSRPVQTEASRKPELARRDVINSGSESSPSVCFRSGVHRTNRAAEVSKIEAEQEAVNGVSKTSSPAQLRRYSGVARNSQWRRIRVEVSPSSPGEGFGVEALPPPQNFFLIFCF